MEMSNLNEKAKSQELTLEERACKGIRKLVNRIGVGETLNDNWIKGIYFQLKQGFSLGFLADFGDKVCNQENLKPYEQYSLYCTLVSISKQTLPEGRCPNSIINAVINNYHAQLFIDGIKSFREEIGKRKDYNYARQITFSIAMRTACNLGWFDQCNYYVSDLKEPIKRIVGRGILIGKQLLKMQREECGRAYLQDVLFTGRAYKKTAECFEIGDRRREKLLERALLYYKVAFMQEDWEEEVHAKWYSDAGEICRMISECTKEKNKAEIYKKEAEHYTGFSRKLSDNYHLEYRREDLTRIPKERIERFEKAFSPYSDNGRRDNSKFYSR